MFGVISYCQRGADLFLSAHSSMRYVLDPQSVFFFFFFFAVVSCNPLLSFFIFRRMSQTIDFGLMIICYVDHTETDAHQCFTGRKKSTLVKSLCNNVCFTACFIHVHCIT